MWGWSSTGALVVARAAGNAHSPEMMARSKILLNVFIARILLVSFN
jgi:hypothetical protein